jgi:ethanolamine ammonia-lyase small subunit
MSATIFVRERRKVDQGEKKPRFRVVGVSGGDVKIYVKHMRKKELDQLAEATGAKVVFLKAGKEGKTGAGE